MADQKEQEILSLGQKIDRINAVLKNVVPKAYGAANYFVDVRRYVKFDGTDETALMQQAADDAVGRTLLFSKIPGTPTIYEVSEALWIQARTRVIADPGVTIKRKDNTIINTATYDQNNVFCCGSTKGTRYTADNPGDWITFEGIEIDGNCQNQSGYAGAIDFNKGGWGIYALFVKSVVMRDLNVHHCFAGGVLTSRATGTVLDNVECSFNAIQSNFGTTGNGFDLNGASDSTNPELRSHILLSNCKSHDNADEGFVVTNCSDISYSNCHAWNNGNSAYSTNSVIGFEMTGPSGFSYPLNVQINNCTAINNVRTGISGKGTGLRYDSYGNVDNFQVNNFIAKGHDGIGVDIDFIGSGTIGSTQINNAIVDGYGTAGQSYAGFQINRSANVTVNSLQISNVEVKNGAGTGTAFSVLSNSSGGKITNLSLANITTENSPGEGIAIYGNIDNLTGVAVKGIGSQLSGIKISPNNASYIMDNISLTACQAINNNQSASAGDGIAFYPNLGTINKATLSSCIANGNRYGLTVASAVQKCYLDSSCNFTGNTTGNYNLFGNNCNYGVGAPTAGTWSVGEKVYNTNPSAGGYEGWVCIAAGTPGTWKGFGAISA